MLSPEFMSDLFRDVKPIPVKNPKKKKKYRRVIGYKTCSEKYGCGEQKPNADFPQYANGKFKSVCKECEAKRANP